MSYSARQRHVIEWISGIDGLALLSRLPWTVAMITRQPLPLLRSVVECSVVLSTALVISKVFRSRDYKGAAIVATTATIVAIITRLYSSGVLAAMDVEKGVVRRPFDDDLFLYPVACIRIVWLVVYCGALVFGPVAQKVRCPKTSS